jgi:hypothetical protein
MQSDEKDKVLEIFREFVGERGVRLSGFHCPTDANSQIREALAEGEDVTDDEALKFDAIGFHLVDWRRDAAFIVALVPFPERFSHEEIRDEIDRFLVHVPEPESGDRCESKE